MSMTSVPMTSVPMTPVPMTTGTASPSPVRTAIVTNPAVGPAALGARGGRAVGLSRSHILDAAGACFAESGYDGTTIRAIAGRLGCSVGSIYRYFRDKRELLLGCGGRVFGPVLEEMEGGGMTLEGSVRTYLRRAGEHAELYRLLFWLAAGRGGAGVPEPVGRVIDGWAVLLGERAGARDGAERCWAMAHGMLMLGCGVDRIVGAVVGVPGVSGVGEGERGRGDAKPRGADGGGQGVWEKEDVTLL